MGTINYYTSDYLTLAINTNDYIEPYNYYDYEADTENAAAILDQYDFYYYHVTTKPGYYEGVSINIENNFPVAYDDYTEKREVQKEITQLKKALYDLAGVGFALCFPGWCTTYGSYEDTKKAINEAIKEMRNEARQAPTWRTYCEGFH